jgi:hypothetical protein
MNVAPGAHGAQRRQRRAGAGRTEGEQPIDLRITLQGIAYALLRVSRIGEVDGQHGGGAARRAHRVAGAAAALVQRQVADLVIDAQQLARAGRRQLFTTGAPGFVLRLTDVREYTQLLPCVGARIDETSSPAGRDATAASMSWLMRTMSKLVGAWYSTRTPRSSAASVMPFATTDQKGSADCPCVTATMRMFERSVSCWSSEDVAVQAESSRRANSGAMIRVMDSSAD